MKLFGMIKGLAVCLAVVGFCMPQPLLAATQAKQAPNVMDVELQGGPQGDVLLGQVLDQQGVAKAKVPVSLYKGGKKLASATTDQNGRFAFSKLRGGVYQVAAAKGVGAYRVWAPNTAPPSANKGALVVANEDLARGQMGRLKFWLSHPLVIAGLIATAVAIPVAIHNSGSRS